MSSRWMARPRRRYDLTILRDALLMALALFLVIAACSTGY